MNIICNRCRNCGEKLFHSQQRPSEQGVEPWIPFGKAAVLLGLGRTPTSACPYVPPPHFDARFGTQNLPQGEGRAYIQAALECKGGGNEGHKEAAKQPWVISNGLTSAVRQARGAQPESRQPILGGACTGLAFQGALIFSSPSAAHVLLGA